MDRKDKQKEEILDEFYLDTCSFLSQVVLVILQQTRYTVKLIQLQVRPI